MQYLRVQVYIIFFKQRILVFEKVQRYHVLLKYLSDKLTSSPLNLKAFT